MISDTRNNRSVLALFVRAGGTVCAIPLPHVVEVMRPQAVEAVAGSPAFVRGMAVIRGEPVPVVDLDALLGGEARPGAPPAPRFVSVRTGERQAALAVEAVLGVQELDESELRSMPPLLRDATVEAVKLIGTHDRELMLVLETAKLVPFEARTGAAGSGGGPE